MSAETTVSRGTPREVGVVAPRGFRARTALPAPALRGAGKEQQDFGPWVGGQVHFRLRQRESRPERESTQDAIVENEP